MPDHSLPPYENLRNLAKYNKLKRTAEALSDLTRWRRNRKIYHLNPSALP